MKLEPIIYALTIEDRPHNRARWVGRGFRTLHGRRLMEYWQKRIAVDAIAAAMAEVVWQRYVIHEKKKNAGPGSRLEWLLSWVGIKPLPGCKCKRRAALMDERGPDWCARNIGIVLGWLREESASRSLPFYDSLARLFLRAAIWLSRRELRRLAL